MSQNRQLAAIMFTDIVGYTALMGNDEQKAFSILSKNRQLQKPVIEKYGGRWIKEIGDGVLASFSTVSDAVYTAKEIQEQCSLSGEFSLRIGIHHGEVVFESDDVFGDAVNLASRIQSVAPPGGILVSESVYQNILNKQHIQTKFRSEEFLKNVHGPVRLYEVITEATIAEPAQPTVAKNNKQKSIVVLPFINMSSDPEQEYFSDGIMEEIITDLSHIHDLLVISRSSAMTFKNSGKKIKEVARELNVDYVLEGSVRKAGSNLRITAQLVDANKDAHIWAEKYNGSLEDIFDIQEKVSRSIVDAFKLKLTKEEEKQIAERPISNIEAYDFYLRARRELTKWNIEALETAKRYIETALDIIGPNSLLYGAMGYVYWSYANLGIDPEVNLQKADEFAKKSFLLDPDSQTGHLIKGIISIWLGNAVDGVKHLNKLLDNNPNNFDALLWKGIVLMIWGKYSEAKTIASHLYHLDPLNDISNGLRGGAEFYAGNFQPAIDLTIKALEIEPDNTMYKGSLAFCYAYNQQHSQAINFINEKITTDPKDVMQQIALLLRFALMKDQKGVLEGIESIQHKVDKDLQYSHFISAICAFARLNDQALYWLEKAIDNGFYNYPFLSEHETAFKHLRNEERYSMLLHKVKLKWEQLP